jgi:hypothetical protein
MVPLLFVLAGISKADFILHYRGGPLTPCVEGACRVSIDMLIEEPLPGNASLSSLQSADFVKYISPDVVVSDGIHTFHDVWKINASIENLSTDAAGNLSGWRLFFEGLEGTEGIWVFSGVGDQVSISGTASSFSSSPGTWEVTPEPGSWALAGTAFIACAGIERRRRRRRVL